MESLKTFVTTELPYYVVIHYQLMDDSNVWQDKVRHLFDFFEMGIRWLALALVGQYLIRDRGRVNDPALNVFLEDNLDKATLSVWQGALFGVLQAYAGHRDIFFFPEWYDLHWDTSQRPIQPRVEVREPFERLLSLHADLRTAGRKPTQEREWQALFEQAHGYLAAVIEGLSFLQHYELIKIAGEQAGRYSYDRYVGTKIHPSTEPLETIEQLQVNRLYLMDERDHRLLKLHPLVSLLGGITAEVSKMVAISPQDEPGLYHHYDGDAVYYLLPSIAEWHRHSGMTGEFVASVVWALRKRLEEDLQRRAAEKGKAWERLTWEHWREIVHEVSLHLSGHIQMKYSSEVYLQRQQAFEHVEQFLKSEQTCLLITGKSGVGKSNFIASLLDYWWEHDADVAMLLYDGARLRTETPFGQQVSEDVGRQLGTIGVEGDWKYQDLQGVSLTDRQRFVIVVDAINENQNAREILRRVDRFIGQVTQPWLKVIITSRPAAWRAMKRRQHLAEHKYYRPTAQDDIEYEIMSFDDRSDQDEYELSLPQFTGYELRDAYEKYRQSYGLQTAHQDLTGGVRQLLRDPLMLRLVAQMYRGAAIPQRLKVSQVYREYMDNLVQREALEPSDVRFLEDELVPLMISEGRYSNVITAEQIGRGQTKDGMRLVELVYDETLLSDGRPFNAVFQRLVDAETLVRRGVGYRQEIGFKYERFYDDYAGRRLYEVVNSKAEKGMQYRELMGLLREKPYLWGPVKIALQAEMREGNETLILRQALTEETVVKEMIVAALIEFGSEQAERAHSLLSALLATPQKGLKRGKDPDLTVRMARRAAVEAASALGAEQILARAARDDAPSIRTLAAQHTYYLWQKDREKGYWVLEDLARDLRGIRLLWHRDEMEVLVSTMMMIGFGHFGDPGLEQLGQLARAQGDSVLLLRKRGLFAKVVRKVVERAMPILVGLLKRQIEHVEEADVVLLSVPELAQFFDLPRERREQFHRLVPYMNPELDIEPVWEDVKDLVREPDVLCNYLVDVAMWGRSIIDPQSTRSKWFELLDATFTVEPYPTPMGLIAFWALGREACIQGDVDDELLETYLDYLHQYEKASSHICGSKIRKYRWIAWNAYAHMHYMHYGNVDSPQLQSFLERMKENQDWEALRLYAYQIAYEVVHIAQNKPIVWALRPLVEVEEPTVRDALMRALAWIRDYNPSSVEDFLEEMKFAPEEQRRVHSLSGETVGQVLERTALVFARKILLNPSDDTVRRQFIWWFEQAQSCDDVTDWLSLFIKTVINLIYGEKVFHTTQPDVR